jgi:hypothetical protein
VKRLLKNLGEVFDAVVTDKRRAAASRFSPRPPGLESPRDVFLDSTAAIACAFPDFAYAKSGPHLTRRHGDWTDRIAFQSSHNNVASQRVALWVFANVRYKPLEAWRSQSSPFVKTAFLAGGQLGNLQAEPAWIDLDLADPNTRPSVISAATELIDRIALPYFAFIHDLERVCDDLMNHDIRGIELPAALDLVLLRRGKAAAERFIDNFLQRRSDLVPDFATKLALVDGGDRRTIKSSAYTAQLAVAIRHYGLSPRHLTPTV